MGLDRGGRADSDQFTEEVTQFHFATNLRICLGIINCLIELLLTCIDDSGKVNTFVDLIRCLPVIVKYFRTS